MALLSSLKKFLAKKGCDATYWIGFSGGVDSLSLLHALVSLRETYTLKLKAIHVNHNLHADATQWAAQCESICKELRVELIAESVFLNDRSNLEETARHARYRVFADYLNEESVLLTAHHQDDQAETVLLQLFRGAGPKGLSAMPVEKKLGQGVHCRPLLTCSREAIHAYAKQHHLKWIDDPSNANTHLTRNFLRADVFPLLQQRWPSVSETLARVAENCGETQTIVEEIARQDVQAIAGSQPQTLSLSKLAALSDERQRQALRTWLRDLNFPVPNQKKLLQLQRDFMHAAQDRFPYVTWENVELRRFNDDLYAMACLTELDSTQTYAWDFSESLKLPHVTLKAELKQGQGLNPNLKNISVRFRQGGEVCKVQGKTITQELKKIFQEKNLPTWKRARVPLIYVGDKLAAAVGLFIAAEFAAELEEYGWVVRSSAF